MIIDKLTAYKTAEDQTRLEEIDLERGRYIEPLKSIDTSSQEYIEASKKIHAPMEKLDLEEASIKKAIEDRYIKAHSKKALLADVTEIVNAIEKQDFKSYINIQQIAVKAVKQYLYTEEQVLTEYDVKALERLATENYENCFNFILDKVKIQLKGLEKDQDSTEKAIAIIEKRVALWYVKQQPAYLPMAHGKATDALAFINSRNITVDKYTKSATMGKFEVQLIVRNWEQLQTKLGISTDKLLSTAIATFTQQNDFRHDKTTIKREVAIPLREYAQLLGYDVEEHETSTPEEAEKEKKRAKNQLDNARKAIKKDLDIIHSSSLSWEEQIKGKPADFARVSLVSYTGIIGGVIRIAFTPEIATYLAERNLITQYPTKLLGISGRQPNAYYIGRKLAEHYNIDNNQIRGTHNRISIPALLAVTDLPSYTEVQKKDRGHWAERIKEPLENALDTLTEQKILKDWKYTHARGIDLTEEEAYNITSYTDFAKLYLHFTMQDTVDHTERIEAKQEAREKARKKKADNKKK